ncbi:hypothetical protein [uncultured Ruegeria sp.]|uniref:hypothetical protein n=1 Tax=uncultured Ruegeria sp. TaxID=259304 RepID=UPI002623A9ED|nr:hypothetical protein [uncultured Ruegeria sp.]
MNILNWFKAQTQSVKDGVRSDQPLEVGRSLTKSFLAVVFVLAILPQHTQDGGWSIRFFAFLTSPSNEIGDTFAGVASVLAFLWIIITVWLQSKELEEQRKEFVKMADAQSKQFNLISSQQEDVDQKAVLLGVKRRLEELERASISFFVSELKPPHNYNQLRLVPSEKNLEIEKYYLELNTRLGTAAQLLGEGRVDLEMSNDNGFCGQKAQLIEALSYLRGLLMRKSNLSLAGKMYQSDLKIEHTVLLLEEVLDSHSEIDRQMS